jgi:exodeoxyribonuclease V beta subunit
LLAPSPAVAAVASEFASTDATIQLAPPPDLTVHAGLLTRCSSYSALTRSDEASTKDYDPEEPATRMKEPGLLADLNLTGNRLGQRIHQLLEQVLGNGRTVDAVTEHLPAEWKTALTTILETPLPLGSTTVTLWQIRARAMAEMHVMLPVSAISPSNLAQALLSDPAITGDPERRTWADELAQWSFGTLTGYFQGYVDLIFEHDGRFYIVDYKTNALQGYDHTSLESAMLHHHYLLQARLYTVALHRHLEASMSDYDPEVHLGGCAYLFVRGFPEQGVWFEPARLDAIAALDRLFAQATT